MPATRLTVFLVGDFDTVSGAADYFAGAALVAVDRGAATLTFFFVFSSLVVFLANGFFILTATLTIDFLTAAFLVTGFLVTSLVGLAASFAFLAAAFSASLFDQLFYL